MAVGTPYIASRIREVEVVTETSQAGILVDNEPEMIAEAMAELLAHPEQRTEMGQSAIEYIHDEHNWRRLGKRVGDALEQACAGG